MPWELRNSRLWACQMSAFQNLLSSMFTFILLFHMLLYPVEGSFYSLAGHQPKTLSVSVLLVFSRAKGWAGGCTEDVCFFVFPTVRLNHSDLYFIFKTVVILLQPFTGSNLRKHQVVTYTQCISWYIVVAVLIAMFLHCWGSNPEPHHFIPVLDYSGYVGLVICLKHFYVRQLQRYSFLKDVFVFILGVRVLCLRICTTCLQYP